MKKCRWEIKTIHRGEDYWHAQCTGIVTDANIPKICPYCGKSIEHCGKSRESNEDKLIRELECRFNEESNGE